MSLVLGFLNAGRPAEIAAGVGGGVGARAPAAELLNSDDEVDERCPGLLLPGSKDNDRAPAGPPVPADDG